MLAKSKICVITFILLTSLLISGLAFAQPSDISGHWADMQIKQWVDEGLASGYPDGTFKPNQEVSRAEFVALTNRAFEVDGEGAATAFTDVKAGQWYYNDVSAAKAAEYIGGYSDGTFQPKKSISRQEVASILVRLLKLDSTTEGLSEFKDADQIPQWSKSAIGALVNKGLMGGYTDNTLRPYRSITRAEAVVMLDRAMDIGLKKTALQGTVTLNGKTIEEAVVRLFEAGRYEVIKEEKTNGQGEFKFDVEVGNYDITAITEEEAAFISGIEVAKDSVKKQNLALEEAAVIRGKIEDGNGKKVEDARVLFTTNPTFVAQTDGNGEYTTPVLPDRTYTVRVYEPGKEDEEPEVLIEKMEVGSVGDRLMETLQASFFVSSGFGGSGPGGSGGDSSDKSITDINATGTHTGDYIITSDDVDGPTTFGPSSGTSEITGTLTVNPGPDGEVTLRNLKVNDLVVKSGASGSLTLEDTDVEGELLVDAADQDHPVRVVTHGTTSVTRTNVKSKVILESTSTSTQGFGDVSVSSEASDQEIELRGTFNGKVSVNADKARVKLAAASDGSATSVNSLDLESDVTLETDTNTTLKEVNVEGKNNISLEGSGTVENVNVSSEAEGATLTFSSSTKVNKLELSSSIKLSGDVSGIDELEVADDNVTIETDSEEVRNELRQKVVDAANTAVTALPTKIGLAQQDAVESALNKVRAAIALDAEDLGTTRDNLKDIVAGLQFISGFTPGYSGADNENNVTQDLTLPGSKEGFTITWNSKNSSIITTGGKVTRPGIGKGDAQVVLTAILQQALHGYNLEQEITFQLKVKALVNKDIIPVDHTLPALLDAVEEAFLSLSDEQWGKLKASRDSFLKNAEGNDVTTEDIIDSLTQANLIQPFERLINSDVTADEARVTLKVIVSLSNLGRDNVDESLGLISQKVDQLKSTYHEEIDRLINQGVNQKAVYDYAVDVCESILDQEYTLNNESDAAYEKSLYKAALGVLKNGQHSELKDVAVNAFGRVQEHYADKEDSAIGEIIAELSFDDINGFIMLAIKNEAGNIANNNDLEDVQDLLSLLNVMRDTSKTFFPVN